MREVIEGFWSDRGGVGRRGTVVAGLAAVLVAALLAGGCASGPQTPPPEGIDDMDRPELLYEAIVSIYEERDLPIDVSSEEMLVVTSEFEEEGSHLRKRYNSRIVRAAPGVEVLKVKAEWEQKTTVDGESRWEAVDDKQMKERSEEAEISLARDIEERFEEWKDERKIDRDERKTDQDE